MSKPIGYFGGTFNPPHAAHFALLHAAHEQLGLTRISLIPSGQPWQKPHVLPVFQRLIMLQKAIHDDQLNWQIQNTAPYPFLINTIESDKDEPSYTINTLRDLRSINPKIPFVLIIGSDQLNNLHTWHEWQSLLDYAHIAVTQREGHATHATNNFPAVQKMHEQSLKKSGACTWQTQTNGCFIPFTLTPSPISSTIIRNAIAKGEDPRNIQALSPSVADYIHQQNLYKHTGAI